MFRQADGNKATLGKPEIDTNKHVGYADQPYIGSPPELFMICDMKGNGLKLRDVTTEMSVKIMAQKSHFFNFKYLSADDDDFTGIGRYSGVYKRNIKTISAWYIHRICKLPDKLAKVWYDLLQPIGEDKKQEWIVQKNDADNESIFYFKSAYRPNYFMATESKSGAQFPVVILGTGRWNVQVLEWQCQKEKKSICEFPN